MPRALVPAIALLGLVWLCGLQSCVSPLDPDTPRRRTLLGDTTRTDDPSTRWFTAEVSFTAIDNLQQRTHAVDSASVEIDTSSGSARVRLRVATSLTPPYNPGIKMLYSFFLRDSLLADGGMHNLNGDPRLGFGALFQFAKARDSLNVTLAETLIASDPSIGSASMRLVYKPGARVIDGTMTATFTQGQRMQFTAGIVISW